MTDIYSSGEDPIAGIDGRTIPDAVEAATQSRLYIMYHLLMIYRLYWQK